MEPAQIFDAAFALPDQSRADLAFQLLQTLKPPQACAMDDAELSSELERRVQAYESGETVADDWEVAAARLRQEFERKGP